jgi:hypothetical protein
MHGHQLWLILPQSRMSLRSMKDSTIRKRIAFDAATWHVLQQLSLDTGKRLQDLANEAFGDLLKKHRRPITLRDALRQSTRMHPANDHGSGLHRRRHSARTRP